MESAKQYLPSLAISLFLILTQGVPAIGSERIDEGDDTNLKFSWQSRSITKDFPKADTFINDVKIAAEISNQQNSSLDTLKILEKSINIAQKIPDDDKKNQTLSEIAVKLAKAGEKQRSLQIFDQLIKLVNPKNLSEREEAIQNISIKMAQAGFVDQALDLGKKSPSNLIKAQTFNEISLILLEAGQISQAKKILEEALQYARLITGNYYYEANGSCANYKNEVLSKIAINLSLQSQINQGLSIAQTISSCSSASGDYTQDYQAWAFLGILNHLQQVEPIKQTWYASQKISSPAEKAQVWSKIAIKMVDLGETSFALSIGKKLSREIPPVREISSYSDINTFIVREKSLVEIGIKLAQKQKFSAGMEIAQTMIENKESLPELLQDYLSYPTPTNIVLIEIAKRMTEAKKLPDALKIINNMRDKNTKMIAQIAVADELQKSGKKSQAAQIFQALSLPQVPIKLSKYEDYHIFHKIAVALVMAKQTEKAMQLVNLMGNETAKESTLTDMGMQLADLGEIPLALNLVKKLPGAGSQQSVNRKIVGKLIEQGKLEQALQITISQLESDSSLISQIAEKFASGGKKEQAIATVEKITDQESQAKAFAAIALMLR
ncbi:tetratricopeptide repeat protein [Calothrix sp. 336/3]|uniref:tetratricopeptide repeat protein n=1 Tax=Calothrix sp. 336/3 TaxID=1337936 RepID=UPI0004E29832|nr:hypothetical protein [Calothrix sp. 336/3]AKG20587.1 hypothetical protein IJ00_03975 [Calothrix sp. 336/3]